MHHPTKERYHYCLGMEYALGRLDAKSITAGLFEDQQYVKEGLLSAVEAIEKRLNFITVAAETKKLINGHLTSLKEEANRLSNEINNDLDIIAILLNIIGLLLDFEDIMGHKRRKVTIE